MRAEFGYEIDAVDLRLLRRLATDGRATWADLAVETDMTAPGVAQRVRRLRERGVLRGFAALIAPEAVAPICAFVSVGLDGSRGHARFRDAMRAMPEVQECHHVAGDADYLVKLRCRSLEHLEELLGERIPQVDGVRTARTTIVVSTVKEWPIAPPAHSEEEMSHADADPHSRA
jgi:Lrp/AsnC family transcriptional regulator, leucine-responsive regulatory protein